MKEHHMITSIQLNELCLAPTDFYSEIGAGIFRGHGFPANPKGNSRSLITAYAHVGVDIGISNAWHSGSGQHQFGYCKFSRNHYAP